MKSKLVVPAGIAIIASTYGLARYTYGLFLPDIRQDFGLGAGVLGAIGSGAYVAYLLATFAGSALTSHAGPRLMMGLGGSCAVVGLLLVALSQNLWMLAAGIFIAGLSPGLAYPAVPDMVGRLVEKPKQSRALTWINAGTSFGVLLAGPVALAAGSAWRTAWLVFAAIAALSTLWNLWLLPPKSQQEDVTLPELRWSWFVCPRSGPLFFLSFTLGLVASIYWTFAGDFIVSSGIQAGVGKLFWTTVGIAGVAGVFGGNLVGNFGLKKVLSSTNLVMGISFTLLAVLPGSLPFALSSAVIFGSSYILLTGLVAIWSVNVFYSRPSAGLGAASLLISAGQIAGPLVAGVLIPQIGFAPLFFAAALLAVGSTWFSPTEEIRSATP